MIGDGAQQDLSRMNWLGSALQSIENALSMLCWSSKNQPHQAQFGPQEENFEKFCLFLVPFLSQRETSRPILVVNLNVCIKMLLRACHRVAKGKVLFWEWFWYKMGRFRNDVSEFVLALRLVDSKMMCAIKKAILEHFLKIRCNFLKFWVTSFQSYSHSELNFQIAINLRVGRRKKRTDANNFMQLTFEMSFQHFANERRRRKNDAIKPSGYFNAPEMTTDWADDGDDDDCLNYAWSFLEKDWSGIKSFEYIFFKNLVKIVPQSFRKEKFTNLLVIKL